MNRPIPIQFDITNSCNLNCHHCYHSHHKNEGALPLDRWLQLLDEYAALVKRMKALPHVIFCGGEPTLSPHLVPMLNRCRELWPSGFTAVVITNATLVDKLFSKIDLDPRYVSFQVSVDGPSHAIHDLHRGAGNFYKVIAGIETLRTRGFDVRLLAVLSRANADRVAEFFDLARSLGVQGMSFTRLISVGNGKTFAADEQRSTLSPIELKQALTEIMRHSVRTNVKTSVQSPLAALLHKDLGRSGRFWESLVIDYRGNYLATSRSRIPIGHVDHDTMEYILANNPFFRPLHERRVEVCGRCNLYDVCGGDRNAAYAATGNFLGPDPGCWKQTDQV